jgi:hypothetical protein
MLSVATLSEVFLLFADECNQKPVCVDWRLITADVSIRLKQLSVH